MDILLLDVNTLLALGWAEHQAHEQVLNRISRPDTQWATCAITQLGFIRISSINGIFSRSLSPSEASLALKRLCADSQHHFFAHNPPPIDFDFSSLSGHKQTTDAYLTALAQWHGARLLTLDKRLAHHARSRWIELLDE